MKLILLNILLVMVLPAVVAQDPKPDGVKYKPGQMWAYKTRDGEETSYFVVLRIDSDSELGTIVHISVRGLKMKNRRSPDGLSEDVDHMPFSLPAINRSAVKLIKQKTELPNFEEGYRMWREAFDAKRAGIYTITIAQAVDVMEKTLNQ